MAKRDQVNVHITDNELHSEFNNFRVDLSSVDQSSKDYKAIFDLVVRYAEALAKNSYFYIGAQGFQPGRFLLGHSLSFLLADDVNAFNGLANYETSQQMGDTVDISSAFNTRNRIIYRLLFKAKLIKYALENFIPQETTTYNALSEIYSLIEDYLDFIVDPFKDIKQVRVAYEKFLYMSRTVHSLIDGDGYLKDTYNYGKSGSDLSLNVETFVKTWEKRDGKKVVHAS